MKIGIIGSGHIGNAVAHLFVAGGHAVTVANSRGPASLVDFASRTGAKPASLEEVARDSDLVVVAIPFKNVADLPSDLFHDPREDLIIVDTTNYYPRQRDGAVAEVENGATESRWVAGRLGHDVVKAFNTIIAEHLLKKGRPAGQSGRIALAVAGDEPQAKAVVMGLIDALGFDAVDAGTIDESWRQQPGSPGYLNDHNVAGVRQALAEAEPARTAEWSATANSPGTYDDPA